MKNVQLKLKELRKEKKLSQEELAETLGISRQSVISLEQGEFLPSLPLLLDIVNFFETPFDEIIFCEGQNVFQKGGEKEMPRDITPWSPFREVSTLHDAIDRMFEESFLPARLNVPSVTVPVVNVRETDKAVIVEAEVPGVKEDDLDIEITEDVLVIRGQKKTEEEIKEKDYYRREFSYGSFSRAVNLPVSVQSDEAEAEIKNGVLQITLPKVEEIKPKGKKITVKKK